MRKIHHSILEICDKLSELTKGAVSSDDVYSLIDDALDSLDSDSPNEVEALYNAWNSMEEGKRDP